MQWLENLSYTANESPSNELATQNHHKLETDLAI